MVSECYLNHILRSLYRSMYFKLPLTVPLSPTEIPLNGPIVLNAFYGIQWYNIGSFLCVRYHLAEDTAR